MSPIITDEEVLYFDARGLIWFVNRSTGQLVTDDTGVHYTTADCTGTAYVETTLPRLVFQASGDSAETFRTLSDRYTTTRVQVQAVRYGTSCIPNTYETDLVPLADTLPATPIVKPTVSFVGPIRLAPQ